MSVNKIKLRLTELDDAKYLKIPLNLDFSQVDYEEVVNREFVEVETEKAINPIVDYEKVRFIPISSEDSEIVADVIYKLYFLNEDGTISPSVSKFADLGFNDDDIRYRKNRFLNSFLRLNFYDSDIPTSQNLVFQMTIFCKVTDDVINPFSTADGEPYSYGGGLAIPAVNFPVSFKVSDPIRWPDNFAEGYHLYHYKSDVALNSSPTKLYMRAQFSNAATGKVTNFITTSEALPINSVIGKLHTRYLLKRTQTGFYYIIDPTYGTDTNVEETTNSNNGPEVSVHLYEIQVT